MALQHEVQWRETDSHLDSLRWFHPLIGGSAGAGGTQGGNEVQRPDGMPTRSECDYVVETRKDLRKRVRKDNVTIYIDDSAVINIGPWPDSGVTMGDNVTLVSGYCDPDVDGRGGIIYQPNYNRKSFVSNYGTPPTLYGLSVVGPMASYIVEGGDYPAVEDIHIDPEDTEHDTEYYAASGFHVYDPKDGGVFKVWGCEFAGWPLAGLELGARNYETEVHIRRSTGHNCLLEGFGYWVEQYNGHLWMDKCFGDRCRHVVAGYGHTTESWEVTESVFGPGPHASHVLDMHDYGGNNRGGHHIAVRAVTFVGDSEGIKDVSGRLRQETIAQRGVSVEQSNFWNIEFPHDTVPDEPGDNGDAYRQETSDQRDEYDNFAVQAGTCKYGLSLERKGSAGAPRHPARTDSNGNWKLATFEQKEPVTPMSDDRVIRVQGHGPKAYYTFTVTGKAAVAQASEAAEWTKEVSPDPVTTQIGGYVLGGADTFVIADDATIKKGIHTGPVSITDDSEPVDMQTLAAVWAYEEIVAINDRLDELEGVE